jgi:ABC-type uncharacterized transport system involved in gliding motility auxiliary subunit
MKPEWRRFAPIGLWLALAALLAAAGLFIVQGEFNTAVQISLGVFVIGLALFSALDPGTVRSLFSGRKARYGSNAVILSIAFIGILVVVNYLGYTNSKRWDLTEDKENTLSPETLEVLTSLTEPVVAKAFYSPNLSSGNAEQLLDQYAFNSDGKFDYEIIDPVQDPAAATDAGITQDGTIVLYMGEHKEQVTSVTETQITSALVRLMNPGGRVIYFLTGHGEASIEGGGNSTYSQLVTRLEAKNYTLNTLNLLAENEIPADATLIIIAGPRRPVSDVEIGLLDTFLKNGGSMIIMEEPRVLTEFGDAVDPLAEYLSANFGITLGEDVVVDLDAAQLLNQPFVAIAAKYGTHAITDKMSGLATFFPTARSLTISDATANDISQVNLIQTTDRAWAETDMVSFMDGTLQPDEGVDSYGPLTVGVVAENLTTNARVVVFGDSEFALNANIQVYGNGDMMVNAVDWAAGEETLINLSPGTTTERYLNLSSPYLNGLVLLGAVFVLPGLVVVGGIIAWVGRRRRG